MVFLICLFPSSFLGLTLPSSLDPSIGWQECCGVDKAAERASVLCSNMNAARVVDEAV